MSAPCPRRARDTPGSPGQTGREMTKMDGNLWNLDGSPTTAAQARPDGGESLPRHDVRALMRGGNRAEMVLDGTVYTLRITRAGKLILTK